MSSLTEDMLKYFSIDLV